MSRIPALSAGVTVIEPSRFIDSGPWRHKIYTRKRFLVELVLRCAWHAMVVSKGLKNRLLSANFKESVVSPDHKEHWLQEWECRVRIKQLWRGRTRKEDTRRGSVLCSHNKTSKSACTKAEKPSERERERLMCQPLSGWCSQADRDRADLSWQVSDAKGCTTSLRSLERAALCNQIRQSHTVLACAAEKLAASRRYCWTILLQHMTVKSIVKKVGVGAGCFGGDPSSGGQTPKGPSRHKRKLQRDLSSHRHPKISHLKFPCPRPSYQKRVEGGWGTKVAKMTKTAIPVAIFAHFSVKCPHSWKDFAILILCPPSPLLFLIVISYCGAGVPQSNKNV